MRPLDDEEALAEAVAPHARLERGVFFTPRPLVERVLEACARYVEGPVAVVDPACGAGAFLSASAERFPGAALLGAELHSSSAGQCRARVPSATVLCGDALGGDAWEGLEARIPKDRFEVWVGNPPYNGTSPLLRTPGAWQRACAWMPEGLALPPGKSLREDYVFFLLRASLRLERRRGVLGFVTSSTLLDAFLYAPVREALLRRLELREVVDLGEGAFRGTRVKACFTVWTSPREKQRPVRFEGGPTSRATELRGPEWLFRPARAEAERLEAQWRARGEPITTLLPVNLPGLKTRFNELLVDLDRDRLFERVRDFLECQPAELAEFAGRHALTPALLPKLRALKQSSGGVKARPSNVRPFLQYRGPLPPGRPAYCYLDRALIPRGDHRLRGLYDPHAVAPKLVFNVHELPLAAHVLTEGGCVTAYRHSRFAPLLVPERLRHEGLASATRGALGDLVPNLSAAGVEAANRMGGVRPVFEAIARFVMTDEVQALWAPAFGTSRVLPVPIDDFGR